MKQKNYYDLYLISREFPNGTFYTQELLQIFGYSKNSSPVDSKINYFVDRFSYNHPKWIWKVRNIVAIKPFLIQHIDYDPLVIPGPNKESLVLVHRYEAPFYLLKEYGGPVI